MKIVHHVLITHAIPIPGLKDIVEPQRRETGGANRGKFSTRCS